MRINFYSGNRIEPWDYRNVFDIGIGGSETSHVEMAIRLAKRGHTVTSYTDLPPDCPNPNFGGVHWRKLDLATFEEDALWIIYRQPSLGAKLTPDTNRKFWLVCQDVFYPDWDTKAVASFDRIIGLCPRHIDDIKFRDPSVAGQLCMSSNGINVERIQAAEQFTQWNANYQRNPARLIWTSSPDRGLKELLDIFERAKEQVSDLELHVFYGMNNIDKICSGDRKKAPWNKSWQQYDRAINTEGVVWRGRIGQKELTKELFQAGIWCYPTWFPETSCISCMEAQACGCIPITNPIWATGYNVKHGIMIEGSPNDTLVKTRYVDAVVQVASTPLAQQEEFRKEMMGESRQRLDWERWVTQWEYWAEVDFNKAINEAANKFQNLDTLLTVNKCSIRESQGYVHADGDNTLEETIDLAKQQLEASNNPTTVLDIGAHVGIFSKLAIERGCQVTAVEPNENIFDLLVKNTKGKAKLVRAAVVTKANGEVTLKGANNQMGAVGIYQDAYDIVCKAPTISLSTLLVTPIDLVKLDIEGGEYDLLAEATIQTLRNVKCFTVEWHDMSYPGYTKPKHTKEQAEAKLKEAGFVKTKLIKDCIEVYHKEAALCS